VLHDQRLHAAQAERLVSDVKKRMNTPAKNITCDRAGIDFQNA
jgi:hypothetical protein